MFRGRTSNKAGFIALVQAHTRYDKATKILYPKESVAEQPSGDKPKDS